MKLAAIATLILAAAAAPAQANVVHLPPADAPAGAPLELVATVPPPAPVVQVHYRTAGTSAYATAELVRRDDQQWVAVVPAAVVTAPGVEYYLDAAGAPVFASAAAPHRTRVEVTDTAERRARDEARTKGRHSRVHTSVEWTDYGTRTVDGNRLIDRYYRVDADFAYRLWAYPLEELRVGYTRLVGDTASAAPTCPLGVTPPCTTEAGFKVAGWFELGLAPVHGIGLDARMIVVATQGGVAVGGRGELRVGSRDATHVAAGVELVADVGTTGFFRLGLGTLEKVPMAATLEITNLPAQTRDTGVRLLYDVGGQIRDNVRLGVRVGYAAREQGVFGFTTGANASIDF
ncbi:MAG: hypothetical protein KIT31_24085 [Deltaproteobacteria bacterium]|nr:hypothetical protein [Deltaproteobacteria bacterium]